MENFVFTKSAKLPFAFEPFSRVVLAEPLLDDAVKMPVSLFAVCCELDVP
jgi:hypothetical protein